jgi:hypothetical protein
VGGSFTVLDLVALQLLNKSTLCSVQIDTQMSSEEASKQIDMTIYQK